MVDFKRRVANVDDERITSATFSPGRETIFCYTTSKGPIKICDMRERSNFENEASLTLNRKQELKTMQIFNNSLRSTHSA